MSEFDIIYKILKILREAMDYEVFDKDLISCDTLGISKPKWDCIIEMLVSSGYITGVTVQYRVGDIAAIRTIRPRITLKGLEYLEENSLMKKAARIAKGIKECIPGI